MVVSITSNSSSQIAQRNVTSASNRLNSSIGKISSGSRVFEAKEDAAALSIGTALRVDVASFRAAQVNISQGNSLLQVADGAIGELTDILSRLNELASTSLSDQLGTVERQVLDTEYQVLLSEFDRIAAGVEFNGVPLLGGTTDNQLNTLGTSIDTDNGIVGYEFTDIPANGDVFELEYFSVTQVMVLRNTTTSATQTINVETPQVGALATYNFQRVGVEITLNSDFDDTVDIIHAGANEEFDVVTLAVAASAQFEFQVGTTTAVQDRIDITMPIVSTNALGLSGTNVLTRGNARITKLAIDSAVDQLNSSRAAIGANLVRLETVGKNLAVAIENSESARSGLLDVDVAKEITEVTAQQTLMQAGISMLSQANQQPDILLGLLRNGR